MGRGAPGSLVGIIDRSPVPRLASNAVRRRALAEFVRNESVGGLALVLATIAALIWVNAASGSYDSFWASTIGTDRWFDLHLDLSLHAWVNDGLMTVFFFVVGLEIKRELVVGELANPRAAVMPAIAALGGMVVPALIYLVVNGGGAGRDGWGIPLATDIAFVLGLLSLLGSRAPSGLRLFLLALAIIDDTARSSSSPSSTPMASTAVRSARRPA